MVHKTKLWWVLFLVLVAPERITRVDAAPEVPCFFIFGDSLADNGNNNNLQTLAKANYAPYGIDYPGGVTGRFTNGRTSVDFLAELLGFDHHIPPFASANGSIILQGVNYASGSAGILKQSGKHLGQNIHLKQQIINHQRTIRRMIGILRNNATTMKLLNRCIYMIGIGSNDYINNYFMPQNYTTSKIFTRVSYAKTLVVEYSKALRTLYGLGARKFALVGLGYIGCIPHFIASSGSNRSGGSICANKINAAIQLFNMGIVSTVEQLNRDIADAKFTYINTTSIGEANPIVSGFSDMTSACCKARSDGQCLENQVPCPDRRAFVFWDTFHPTEATNNLTAGRTYKAYGLSDSYPFDIQGLAQLDLDTISTGTAHVMSGRTVA